MPRTAGRPVVSTTIARVACTFDPRRRDEQSCSSRAGSSARRGGVRERCRSQQLHVLNRVRRESLGQTREGSDRVSRRRVRSNHTRPALIQGSPAAAAQRRGEHGSQQCERCVSRPCLLIVKASCRRLASMPSADEMLSDSRVSLQTAGARSRSRKHSWLPAFSSARAAALTRGGKPRGAS